MFLNKVYRILIDKDDIFIDDKSLNLIYNDYTAVLFIKDMDNGMLLNNLQLAESMKDNIILFKPNKNFNVKYNEIDLKVMSRFHHTFYNLMFDYLSSNLFLNTLKSVGELRKKYKEVYPTMDNQLNVFKQNIFDINIVFLGLEPYPSKHANGYCFATNLPFKPKSLESIEKGMIRDLNLSSKEYGIKDLTLNYLIEQGVFLFNSALTITNKVTKSDLKIWKDLITLTLKTINLYRHKIIVITFGSDASKFSKLFTKNIVLNVEHPARCLYEEREFEHNNVFTRANIFQKENKKKEIEWLQKLNP